MARNGNAKTRRFALNMLKAGVAIFGAALLFACGDDDSSFVTSENGGSAAEADIVVTIFDDLPSCVGKREGVTAYVKDEKIAYICTDADWVVAGETGDGDDDGEKSSSSTAKSVTNKDKSSGSEGVGDASSSSVIASSSSEELVCSCNFNKSSSSSRGLFEMSKDEFLNPKITYGTMTDTRDNKTYKTVKIGTQVWMAENLNYDYNKGTAKSFCYDNKIENCAVTGRLYTWAAAIDSVALANDADNPQICGYVEECTLPTVVQGVCPEGWHLPSNVEWNALFTAVGGTSYAGQKLKADSDLWNGGTSNDDSFGFAVLPAGFRYGDGRFYRKGDYANFWSSTEYNNRRAYYWHFNYISDNVDDYWYYKYDGISVRCLQN